MLLRASFEGRSLSNSFTRLRGWRWRYNPVTEMFNCKPVKSCEMRRTWNKKNNHTTSSDQSEVSIRELNSPWAWRALWSFPSRSRRWCRGSGRCGGGPIHPPAWREPISDEDCGCRRHSGRTDGSAYAESTAKRREKKESQIIPQGFSLNIIFIIIIVVIISSQF